VNGVGTALMSSTLSKAPRTSTMNPSPASTVIVGGVRVLTVCVADAGRDTSTRAWDGEVTLMPP
jgi:hypothetical protein